jgi:hypothetical protein
MERDQMANATVLTIGGVDYNISDLYFREILPSLFGKVRTLTESDDLNNISDVGWYSWSSTHVPAHAPSTNSYILLVFVHISNVVQVAIPITSSTGSARLNYRVKGNEWRSIPFYDDILRIIEEQVFVLYTNFENGNINPSTGQSTSAGTHPLRSGYIPIDEFVSIDVTGVDDGSGNNYTYQLFAYDSTYRYLGYGDSTHHSDKKTRNDILTAYPTTKYIRIKVSGGDSSVLLSVDNLGDYGYEGLVRVTPDSVMRRIEDSVFTMYTNFENGNINASTGQSSSTGSHPLRSGFIPIDEFVSVVVDGANENNQKYRYQLFAYDGAYGYLGFGDQTLTTKQTTRDDVLAAYPNAKYVRIKISGGDSSILLDADDLRNYGYRGFVRVTPNSVMRGGGSGGDVDVMSMIEANKDEDGLYSASFGFDFPLGKSPQILTIVAQYTGTMPTIQITTVNSSGAVGFTCPVYELGGTREPTRKSWRIPAAASEYTKAHISITIPSGTIVTFRDADLKQDQWNRYNDLGIKYHGHRGSVAPADTVEAFQFGAELGYNSMITIPKFTSDGVGVCFHDDGNVSGNLCWMDGTAITGEDDVGISQYTYTFITNNFRIKSTKFGILHVPTLEDYFRVCSLTGMNPILSVHGSGFGTSFADGFAAIKALAKKWNVLNKLGIKSGDSSIQSTARSVFDKDIDCYIFISGTSHAPYSQLGIAKAAGFVDSSATDLSECEYKLISEYFYSQTIGGATYYTETMASIAEGIQQGFLISVATTSPGISGPEMKRLIGVGVTEFTVDRHISMGLDW